MKAACIWDGLAHILSNLTCNKRNMAFSPQASINKEGGVGGGQLLDMTAPTAPGDI